MASNPEAPQAGRPAPVGKRAQLSLRRAALLLAGLVVIWGGNWPVMKFGLTMIPPFWFGAARVAMGAATLFLVLAVLGRLRWPPRHDLPVLLSVGLLQMCAFLALVNLALEVVPAGRSAVLAYTMPLWIAPGAILFLGERLTWRKGAGLLLGLGGLVVLFNPLHFPWHDATAVGGNLLLLAAALCWAVTILSVRRHRWKATALELTPWQLLVALPPLLILALWREGLPTLDWSDDLLAVLIYNGPLATGFCYWASVSLARSLPAVTVSLGFLAVPVAGVLASVLALGEALPPSLLIGMVLVLAGLVFVTLPGRPARQEGAA